MTSHNSYRTTTTKTTSTSSSLSGTNHRTVTIIVPHRGSLCRIEGQDETMYTLEVLLENGTSHELIYLRKDFDFALRLFAIMDTESRGQVTKSTVQEFVTVRCPVFWRRDEDLEVQQEQQQRQQQQQLSVSTSYPGSSPTFEEVWMAVASCSVSARAIDREELSMVEIGVEAWMVFCRFIALAQYLEAKRRFSGRHLQQTMRHRNAPRGSEMVVVDVPPAAPPVRLTAEELAQYERENQKCLPLPELDLDHSLLAAHDVLRRRRRKNRRPGGEISTGHVKIDLFGNSPMILTSTSAQNSLEFCLTYIRDGDGSDQVSDSISVRRSMNDMKWLNDTFISQKALGGTLCGRILPPFPGNRVFVAQGEESSFGATGGAIAAAANVGVEFANAGVGIASAGVGMLKEGFKSLWGGYLITSQSASTSIQDNNKSPNKKTNSHTKNAMHIYYNPNSPAGKARHMERYLNYLLEHPALSTSFPLNTILKVRDIICDKEQSLHFLI